MKLLIKRNQVPQKGIFGGNKGVLFSISFRVEFTPEEKALVDRYKLSDDIVARYNVSYSKEEQLLTVGNLAAGFQNSLNGLGALQELESAVVAACQNLKVYLRVASTFGGEETID